MDPASIQLYATLLETLLNAVSTLATGLKSPATPADLQVILNEVSTRLARRGIVPPTTPA